MSALEESLRKVYGLVGPRETTTATDIAALAKKATMPKGATSAGDMRAIMGKGPMTQNDIDRLTTLLPNPLIENLSLRPGAMSDLEMQLLQGAENMSPEDKETLESTFRS